MMLNAEAVVQQVRQGNVPPQWRVWRAKSSYFVQIAAVGAILLLIGVGATVFYLARPDHVLVLQGAGSTLSDSALALWRTIDFVVFALVILIGLLMGIKGLLDMPKAQHQFLVLTPEGFVKVADKTLLYPFANIQQMKAVNNRGTITFTMQLRNGNTARMLLDGRFGNTKEIAQQIMTARTAVPRTTH
jgi:hypothetical protein